MRNGSENVLMELKVVFGPNQVMQCMVSKIWNKVQKCTVYKFLQTKQLNLMCRTLNLVVYKIPRIKIICMYLLQYQNWEVFNWISYCTMWDKLF